jgi:soluble lytic murein transglycosylase-like protein
MSWIGVLLAGVILLIACGIVIPVLDDRVPFGGKSVFRILVFYSILAGLAFAFAQPACAESIPQASLVYRVQLQRAVSGRFGLDAPVARIAAQIQQESGWHPRAASAYAQGLAQFTPATARWVPSICPDLGKPDPWDSAWSVGAVACYDAWLLNRVTPIGNAQLDACSRWQFALRAYNGGEGMLVRERHAAQRAGANANSGAVVAAYRIRSPSNFAQNLGYPYRILHTLEPLYLNAGWPGSQVCS